METFSALLALCAGNSPVPVNSPHKGQWRGALMFPLIYAWINDWVNNREAGDLRRQRGHYDVIVMTDNYLSIICTWSQNIANEEFSWHQPFHLWLLCQPPMSLVAAKLTPWPLCGFSKGSHCQQWNTQFRPDFSRTVTKKDITLTHSNAYMRIGKLDWFWFR